MKKITFFFLVFILFSGIQPGLDESKKLEKIFDDYVESFLRFHPLWATGIGDDRYNDKLPNFLSNDFQSAYRDTIRFFLERLSNIDTSRIQVKDQLNYSILKYDLQQTIEGFKFEGSLMPINQMGMISFFPELATGRSIQPMNSVKDYDNFSKRMDGYIAILNSSIDKMREGVKKGIVQPKIIIEQVIPILQNTLNDTIEKSIFYSAVANMSDSIPDQEKYRIQEDYQNKIKYGINPVYKKLISFLQEEYLPDCRESIGLSALPNGEEWYHYMININTTTNLSADQIFEMGLEQVEKTKAEMISIKNTLGFIGDLNAFFEFLRTDKQFYYTDADSLIMGYESIRNTVNKNIGKLFNVLPKTDYVIKEMDIFSAPHSPLASYMPASMDGSRPGVFYVNTYKLEERPKNRMETLFLHEAVPGHHLQISLEQENENIPMFKKLLFYTSYAEGWALYSEGLGKDLGLYTDYYSYFGHLSDDIWRSIRLVVDVGIHYKGWTRDQVIEYMLDNSPVNYVDAEAEVNRYIVWPGQALAYKIGEQKIWEIRKKSEETLGKNFDIRAFHDKILSFGSLPLDLLEQEMDKWIASQ